MLQAVASLTIIIMTTLEASFTIVICLQYRPLCPMFLNSLEPNSSIFSPSMPFQPSLMIVGQARGRGSTGQALALLTNNKQAGKSCHWQKNRNIILRLWGVYKKIHSYKAHQLIVAISNKPIMKGALQLKRLGPYSYQAMTEMPATVKHSRILRTRKFKQ